MYTWKPFLRADSLLQFWSLEYCRFLKQGGELLTSCHRSLVIEKGKKQDLRPPGGLPWYIRHTWLTVRCTCDRSSSRLCTDDFTFWALHIRSRTRTHQLCRHLVVLLDPDQCKLMFILATPFLWLVSFKATALCMNSLIAFLLAMYNMHLWAETSIGNYTLCAVTIVNNLFWAFWNSVENQCTQKQIQYPPYHLDRSITLELFQRQKMSSSTL
jgi:hypothetical protein